MPRGSSRARSSGRLAAASQSARGTKTKFTFDSSPSPMTAPKIRSAPARRGSTRVQKTRVAVAAIVVTSTEWVSARWLSQPICGSSRRLAVASPATGGGCALRRSR